jgi:outer membrane protein assembly factor BamB
MGKNSVFLVMVALTCSVFLQASCTAQSRNGQGEYRKFTDSRGRSIQARALEVSGDQVTLQRSDGRRFTVAISAFSEADQVYLRGLTKPAEAVVADGAWPAFRGPGGMGVSGATGLPVEWDTDQNVAWKTALPGAGASTPIVFGDRIYLTAYTGYFVPGESGGSPDQLKRHLLALRLEDGRILWDKAIPAKLPEEESIRDHGFAASSVAVDEERIYVFFGKTGVFAFDHDGNQLWHADVGSKTSGWGSAASPVLYKDMVFINASVESESLVALDRRTGEERWRAGGIREAWNTPLVVTADSGREELVVPTAGTVYAFDPQSGQPLWSCKTDIGWYMVPSAIAADGVIYCLGGRSGTAALAIRAGGSGDVTATHRLWTSQKGSNVSSPVYLDGHLYWTHESREIAYCAVAATGEVVYEERLPRSGQFYASALLADGRLYYLTRGGKTFVLAAKPQFEQLAVNDLSDRSVFNASPAVAGNRLLIRSDKFLYCLQAN